MSFCCCPTSHIRWSSSSRSSAGGGILCCNWPWCLSSSTTRNMDPHLPDQLIPRITENSETSLLIEMEVSSVIPPLWVMCLMSFLPITPCIITCSSDFYAIAWHFLQINNRHNNIANNNGNDIEQLQVRIRRKNACTEEIQDIYENVNSIYLECFDDSDLETNESIWKERLVITTATEGRKLCTVWFLRNSMIHELLLQINEIVWNMIPLGIRRPPPATADYERANRNEKSSSIEVAEATVIESSSKHTGDAIATAEIVAPSFLITHNSIDTRVSETEVLYEVPREILQSMFWKEPLCQLVKRIRQEFSFPSTLNSVEVIERACAELTISPSHLHKVDAVTVLTRIGLTG